MSIDIRKQKKKSEIYWESVHIHVMETAWERGFGQRETPHQALGKDDCVFHCCIKLRNNTLQDFKKDNIHGYVMEKTCSKNVEDLWMSILCLLDNPI